MALNEDVKIFAKEVDGQTQTQIKIKNDNSKVYLKLDPDSEAQWILLEPIISSFKANKVFQMHSVKISVFFYHLDFT